MIQVLEIILTKTFPKDAETLVEAIPLYRVLLMSKYFYYWITYAN